MHAFGYIIHYFDMVHLRYEHITALQKYNSIYNFVHFSDEWFPKMQWWIMTCVHGLIINWVTEYNYKQPAVHTTFFCDIHEGKSLIQ